MKNPIDYRSDTLTQPTPEMRERMARASVGDDVYGEDPSVNELEQLAAQLVGKQAGIFVSSGTQGNLLAMLGHCRRGDEYISGNIYHVQSSEAGGAAVLGGIASTAIAVGEQLEITVESFRQSIKSDDVHHPVSRLLCLENTVHGRVQTQSNLQTLCDLAHNKGMLTHLDGARLMNAAIAQGINAEQLAEPFDSVSLCLSKGLGAPVGSVLCGSNEFIHKARRNRKLLGGGTRQAGVLAACGLYALENNIDRLSEDHSNAEQLAKGLASLKAMPVEQYTNMVFIKPAVDHAAALVDHLRASGIIMAKDSPTIRMVTHLDISSDDINHTVDTFKTYFSNR